MEATDRYAAGYGRAAADYSSVLDPTLEPVALRIVELAQVKEGHRVLDIASGTGAVARAAFACGARVVGLELSERMVEVAREISPSAVEFVVGDAASLPFGRGVFDAVTCGFGLSHMPDVHAVLEEAKRVLAPGGCFVESSWGSEADNPAFAAVLANLKTVARGTLHAFGDILDEDTWADPQRGSRILSQAGFTVEAVTERLHGRYGDGAAALEWTLTWPDYRETIEALSESDRAQFTSGALAACAGINLDWWFAINYFVARLPDQQP